MPELVELHEEWSGKGVRVQTVALDVVSPRGKVDTAEEIGAFLEQRGFDVPTLAYDGPIGALAAQWGVTSTPVTVAIDRDGQLVDAQLGAVKKARLEEMIQRALAE